MSAMDYAGKVVVVTGGAGGLGLALGRRFASAGAHLALLDLDGAGAVEAARTLQAAHGIRAIGIACDVTSETACAEAMQDVLIALGGIDLLINNAGIAHRSLFAETDTRVLRRVMDVNFFGAVHCTRAALPVLRARRGQVAAISSIAGFSPLFGRTGYSASKHALHGFFDSLRSELEDDGVDVTLVCPAFVATGIERAALGGDGGTATLPRNAVGEEMHPDEMAERIFRALQRRQSLYLPTMLARASWWISRLAPGFFARTMKRRVAPRTSA